VPRLTYGADTALSPEQVIDAVKDFSERRAELWPKIDSYEINEVTEDFADVTEGTDFLGKNFWARERYEWPEPGLVRTTTTDSNVFEYGSSWQLRATAGGGASRVEVVNDRKMKRDPVSRLIGLGMRLTKRTYRKELEQFLSRVEDRARR
jgi:Polyketide cyclase / dehydrase and lipid transport